MELSDRIRRTTQLLERLKERAMIKKVIERYTARIEELQKDEGPLDLDSLEAMLFQVWESLKYAVTIIESDPVKEIRYTVESLRDARLEESRRGYLLAGRQADLTRKEGSINARSNSIVSRAYADELITGKNAEIRKAQEHQLVMDDELISSFENEASAIRSEIVGFLTEYDTSKVNRKYWEDLLSAQRAVLLFLSRTENL